MCTLNVRFEHLRNKFRPENLLNFGQSEHFQHIQVCAHLKRVVKLNHVLLSKLDGKKRQVIFKAQIQRERERGGSLLVTSNVQINHGFRICFKKHKRNRYLLFLLMS